MAGKRGARPGARNVERKGEIVALAAMPVPIPEHLNFYNHIERDYYARLLGYRAPNDWHGADLDRLKTASENWWNVQVEREILDSEDAVIYDENGKAVVNPRLRAIDIYQKTHDATLRGLGISRSGMRTETLAKRRDDVEAARTALVPDRLLTQTRGLAVVGGRDKDGKK